MLNILSEILKTIKNIRNMSNIESALKCLAAPTRIGNLGICSPEMSLVAAERQEIVKYSHSDLEEVSSNLT